MVATFLVEHAWAVPLVFLALVAGIVPLGMILLRTGRGGRHVTRGLGLLALLVVVPLTLLPEGEPSQIFCTVQFAWPSLRGVETLANITLLLPATFFLTLLLRRPVLVAAAASAGSALIELVQAILPVIGRACDTTDWEMNTIGAALGAVLAWLAHRLSPGSAARPVADDDPGR